MESGVAPSARRSARVWDYVVTVQNPPVRAVQDVLGYGWPSLLAKELDVPQRGEHLIAELANSPFQSLGIPAGFGGGDGGLLELAAAHREIAIVDPSAAIGLAMHSLSIGLMVQHWRRRRDLSWLLLEGVREKRALVASAFSEPGGSSNLLRATTTAEEVADGYVVTGRKYPCSLATTARLFCFNAQVVGTPDVIVGLCPSNAPGVSIGSPWTAIGMRDSDTRSITFDRVTVDERLVFYRAEPTAFDEISIEGLVWFSALMAATYHGVLTRLADHLRSAVRTIDELTAPRPPDHSRAIAGRALGAALSLGSLVQTVAGSVAAGSSPDRTALARSLALRTAAASAVDEMVAACRLVIGGRTYDAGHETAQLILDALAIHHHPPALAVADDLLVAAVLDANPSLDIIR